MPDETLKHSQENYISKITLKGIGCKPAAVTALPAGEKWPLARIYGVLGETRFKDSVALPGSVELMLVGEFEAINLETGEVFRSGKLYLPPGIAELMQKTLIKLQSEDEKASVEFAFEIRTVHATNPIGYSYEAQAIGSAKKVDALAQLRGAMAQLPVIGPSVTGKEKQLTSGKKK